MADTGVIQRRWHPAVLPVAILALGAVLRFARLDWTQYRRDDAIVLGLAQHALATHQIPWVGMISTLGIDNGPAQVWLVVLGAVAGASPFAASWTIALLNVVAIAAAYAFARQAFDRRVALATALLMAVAAWSVFYSRRLWGNDMLAPFAALTLWSLARIVRRGDRAHQVLVFVWAAMLAQVYVVGMLQLLVVGFGLVAAAAQRRLRPLPTAVGAAIFCVLTGPYFLRTVLPELGALGKLGGGKSVVDLTSLRYAAVLVGPDAYQEYMPQLARVADANAGALRWAAIVAAVLLAIGAVLALWRAFQGPSAAGRWLAGLTVLWAAAPVLALLRHGVTLYPHYELGSVPASYTLMALPLAWLFAAKLPWPSRPVSVSLRAIGVALLAVVVTAQMAVAGAFLATVPSYVRGTQYGIPLADVQAIALAAQQAVAASHATRVVVIGTDDGLEMGQALQTWLPDVTVVDDHESLRIPAGDESLVLMTTRDDSPMATFLRDAAPSRLLRFPGDGTSFRLFTLTTAELRASAAVRMPGAGPWTFAGDVRLDGWSAPHTLAAGQSFVWSARWTVTATGANDRPVASLFAHVLSPSAQQLAGHDQAFDNHASDWQPGDEILTWLPVSLPANVATGPAHLAVGLYRLGPASQILPLVGPAGPQLAIGTVQVAGVSSAVARTP